MRLIDFYILESVCCCSVKGWQTQDGWIDGWMNRNVFPVSGRVTAFCHTGPQQMSLTH